MRLRFRYSLRLLLAVVTVVAIVLGYYTEAARRQREAVVKLTQAGAMVLYEYEREDSARTDAPTAFQKWLGKDLFFRVHTVAFGGRIAYALQGEMFYRDGWLRAPANDETLKLVSTFKHLRRLDLRNTKITNAGLAHIVGLTELEELNLNNTAITDEGLSHLTTLVALKYLWLVNEESGGVVLYMRGSDAEKGIGPTITDGGVRWLLNIPSLESVELAGTDVTDKGLEILAVKHPALQNIGARWTRATPWGIERANRLAPNCAVGMD